MPNWCYNTVILRNENTELVDDLEKELIFLDEESKKDGEIESGILNYFYQRPVEEDENWYNWNVENWGTKWDVTHVTTWERDDEMSISMSFDTAWGPPTALYDHITEEDNGNWDVFGMYAEPGMSFVGEYTDGFDNFIQYDFEESDWRDSISEDLIDFAGLDYEYENWLEWQEEE
jgi:hypothetical protein